MALDLARSTTLIEEVERAGHPRPGRVPAALRRRLPRRARRGRQRRARPSARRCALATHDPAPPPEAYIAGSGGIFRDLHIHDFDAMRFVTGEEIVEVYADGAVRETAWFGDHDDVDVAVAVLRLSGGALAILSGTRHDRSATTSASRPSARGTASSPASTRGARSTRWSRALRAPVRATTTSWTASSRVPRRTGGLRRDGPRRRAPAPARRTGARSAARRTGGRPLAAERRPIAIEEIAARQPPPAETARNPTKETGMGIEDEMHETFEEREGSPARPDRQGGTARGRPHGIRRARARPSRRVARARRPRSPS